MQTVPTKDARAFFFIRRSSCYIRSFQNVHTHVEVS
jgi:hypothetical protein